MGYRVARKIPDVTSVLLYSVGQISCQLIRLKKENQAGELAGAWFDQNGIMNTPNPSQLNKEETPCPDS
jgi:hypothetical protein